MKISSYCVHNSKLAPTLGYPYVDRPYATVEFIEAMFNCHVAIELFTGIVDNLIIVWFKDYRTRKTGDFYL